MAKKAKKVEPKKEVVVVKDEPTALAVPAYMKAFVDQSKSDVGSLITSSMSVPRLSYRGKRWRFIEDGEEELMKELEIDVIIVGVEPGAGRFIKTYYATKYNPGDSNPPTCSSTDGISPDTWVSDPQAQFCNKCAMNIFGSAVSRSGGKSKACQDGKRLWLLRTDLDDYGTIYGLNIPVMSLKNLAEYGRFIAKNNYPLSLILTRLSMNDEAEFPVIELEHVGFVDEDEITEIMEITEKRSWEMPTVPAQSPQYASPQTQQRRLVEPEPSIPERKIGTENINDIVGSWDQSE